MFGVAHNEELAGAGIADRDKALFANRMIGIGNRPGERITKDRRCFLERDVVCEDILLCLLRVPSELHLGCRGSHMARSNVAHQRPA